MDAPRAEYYIKNREKFFSSNIEFVIIKVCFDLEYYRINDSIDLEEELRKLDNEDESVFINRALKILNINTNEYFVTNASFLELCEITNVYTYKDFNLLGNYIEIEFYHNIIKE